VDGAETPPPTPILKFQVFFAKEPSFCRVLLQKRCDTLRSIFIVASFPWIHEKDIVYRATHCITHCNTHSTECNTPTTTHCTTLHHAYSFEATTEIRGQEIARNATHSAAHCNTQRHTQHHSATLLIGPPRRYARWILRA